MRSAPTTRDGAVRALTSQASIALGFLLLVCCASSIVWLFWQQRAAETWVRHTLNVEHRLDQIQIATLQIEAEQRGYVYAGLPANLERFETLSGRLPGELTSLARMTTDNSRQRERMPKLRSAVAQWHAGQRHSVDLRRMGRAAEAVHAIQSGAARIQTARMLETMKTLYDEEARLLAERRQHSAQLGLIASTLMIASLCLAILLAYLVSRDRRVRMRLLRQANNDLEYDIHERHEMEAQLALLADNATDAVFRLGLDGTCHYASPSVRTTLGYDPAAMIGHNLLVRFHPDDTPDILACHRDLASGASDHGVVTFRAERPGERGSWRWLEANNGLVRDPADGSPIEIIASLRDVTMRKQAEAARLESERLYRLLADNSNDLIVRLTLDGVRLYVSPASLTLLGYVPDELVGLSGIANIHPDDRAMIEAACREVLNGADDKLCVFRERKKNGGYAWLEASFRLIRDAGGTPIEFIASARDVSRRQTAELETAQAAARLRESHRLLTMAEMVGQIGHWRFDSASGTIFWSDVVCQIHGFAPGHSPTLASAMEIFHADDRPMVQGCVGRALAMGESFDFSARICRADDAVRHIVCRGRAERAPSGDIVGLFGVLQDVTDAYEADVALRKASQRLGDSIRLLTMAESVAKLGHWRIDHVDNSLFWSDEIYRIYGFPRDTVPTVEQALAVYHPDDVDAVRRTLAHARAAGESYTSQARIIRPDGAIVHILTRGEIDHDADGTATGLFGIVQDITDQVEAEAQLQEREARFRLLTDQASDMISLQDSAGRCLYMSPSARTVLGYDPAEMVGTTADAFVPEEDHAVLERHRADLMSGEPGQVWTARFRMRHHDGRLVWIEAAARIADYQQEARIIVVCRDVSDQVYAEDELRAARQQAEAAAQAKASFLANMSHEIRTPMNGVMGFTELLLAGELSDEQRQRAEMIADSGRAMMRLLNDILDVSKVEAGQMTIADEPFDLVHTLKACMKLVAPALATKGLEAICEFDDALPKLVRGDGLRLRQIVLNLMGNAAKFTAEGSVTLRSSATADGASMVIAVEDTGIGISADRQAAIFEPFVQADGGISPRFGGTGLGLSISIQLARLMGGDLRLESLAGRGSNFILTLPLVPAGTQPDAVPLASTAATVNDSVPTGLRILVAEDHDVNQLLMTDMLSQLGVRSDIAVDGAEAVEMAQAARASNDPYAILLMDMQMPKVDGLEATRRIRSCGITAATLPIVALTANAYSDDISACLDAGMQDHLAKPLSLVDLERTLQRWAIRPTQAASAPAPSISPQIIDRYRARRAETLQALDRLVREGRFENAELAEVAGMLHKLAGTAAMFGDGALGEEARLLEDGLESWCDEDRPDRIRLAVEAISRVA